MTQMLTQIVFPTAHRLENLVTEINRHRRTRTNPRTRHANSVCRTGLESRHRQQRHIRLRQTPQRATHHKSTSCTPHRRTLNNTRSARITPSRTRRHETSQPPDAHSVAHRTRETTSLRAGANTLLRTIRGENWIKTTAGTLPQARGSRNCHNNDLGTARK
jgi:hypothetical protein